MATHMPVADSDALLHAVESLRIALPPEASPDDALTGNRRVHTLEALRVWCVNGDALFLRLAKFRAHPLRPVIALD